MKKLYKISVPLEYIVGYIRYGHLEATIEAESQEEAITLFDPDFAEVIVDDCSIEECGDPILDSMTIECVE